MDEATTDNCYRCGYNLVGIENAQPCPECGLLAERSRHVTDELHQSRPKWLWRLSLGIWIVLLAGILPVVGLTLLHFADVETYTYLSPGGVVGRHLFMHLQMAAADLCALMIFTGFFLLASPEGYPPADQADRTLRRLLRLSPLVPIFTLAFLHYMIASDSWHFYLPNIGRSELGLPASFTIGCMPMPILVAIRLRGLAKRAGSAHLAEHCMIVGIGVALTLLYSFGFVVIFQNAEHWGLGANWTGRGWPSLIVMVVMAVLSILMILWAVYVLIRFAIAFATASLKLSRQWRRDDRSVVGLVP